MADANAGGTKPVIDVQGLKTYFHTEDGIGRAVDDVSFKIGRGEVLGIVGESGCGKSVTSLSIMRLVPSPPGRNAGGKILFQGEDLLTKSDAEMRRIRGNKIAMIFQEPMTSLNPVFTVGEQIIEAIRLHMRLSYKEAEERTIDLLEKVGIPGARERVHCYPHEFSGGMRQRAVIAMALACDPALIIADEPTTALDVTIQAQILDLMNTLREELDTAIMLITHSLPVVAETCHRVVVMYAGRVVEEATVYDLFEKPRHPYTIGLLGSLPKLGTKVEKLQTIEGVVPSPFQFPKGCRFIGRCLEAHAKCHEPPPLFEVGDDGHTARCWLYEKGHDPLPPEKRDGKHEAHAVPGEIVGHLWAPGKDAVEVPEEAEEAAAEDEDEDQAKAKAAAASEDGAAADDAGAGEDAGSDDAEGDDAGDEGADGEDDKKEDDS